MAYYADKSPDQSCAAANDPNDQIRRLEVKLGLHPEKLLMSVGLLLFNNDTATVAAQYVVDDAAVFLSAAEEPGAQP